MPNSLTISNKSNNDYLEKSINYTRIFVGLLLIVTLSCFLLCIYLGLTSTVTDVDVSNASWLGSPTITNHFITGFMSKMMIILVIFVGTTIAMTTKEKLPLINTVLVASLLVFTNSTGYQKYLVESGIYLGEIRIGCYVWDTQDCQEMIGVPYSKIVEHKAYPKYDVENKNDFGKSKKYVEAFNAVNVKRDHPFLSALHMMPMGAIFISPLIIANRAGIKKEIEFQRSSLITKKTELIK